MRNGLSVPIIVAVLLLVLFGFIYANAPVVNVQQQNAVIDSIRALKQENNTLNQDLFEVSTNRVRHYSNLSHAQQNVEIARRQVENNLAALKALDRMDLDDRLSSLENKLDRKNEYIERFKQHHARFKNSLDYYPIIMSEIRRSSVDKGMIEFYGGLAQNVIYYALSGDAIWRTQATTALDKLTKKMRRMGTEKPEDKMFLVNFIAHSRLLLEGADSLSRLSKIESRISINSIIDGINDTYLKSHEALNKKQETYRQYLFAVILGFVLLVAYTLVLVARNAVALAREKQRAEVTLGSIGNGVIVTDGLGLVQFMNPMAEQLTEISTKDAQGRPIEEIFKVVADEGGSLVENSVRSCLRTSQHARSNEHAVLITSRKNEVVVEHSAAPIMNDKGLLDGVVMVFDDVTSAHRMARKLEHQASHDALTGLVNRREFENRITEALVTAKQDVKSHALLYLDLDQFKIVNDTCGHTAGDELLKQVVEEIRVLLRASDTFARLGGDEFGILLGYCGVTPAVRLADKVLNVVRDYRFSWDGKTFQIGVSIGVIPITPESDNLASVLSAADMACYTAKDLGRDQVHVYEPSDEVVAARAEETNWVGRINAALENEEFVLYGQNIVSVGSVKQEKHQELLIRMRDEDGSHIPPGAFLPAAARYNHMPNIDRWVISNAFEYYSHQIKKTPKPGLLCINLAGDSLAEGTLIKFVLEQMKKYGVEPSHICFEIKEIEAISNLNDAREVIKALQESGFKFALDDFGSGMASFSYLKNLPVNYLKIDGTLVKRIVGDEIARAMVEVINLVAHIMCMETIAEFVENDEILAVLEELGVDYAQGFGVDMPKLVYSSNGVD